ncbi:MAG: hypothetical protein DRI86_12960 [Bacteroidetes bacterium]|nr:MAG: hypothetical protein DRI86_12960 [Bacteroidota bacterium]
MINRLFKNSYFLSSLQFVSLTVFVLLIYGGIGITTDDPDFAKILRNTNLPNLIVWSYWWPMIIVTAILFGRFWCSICPMELITSFFGKIGLRKRPGKILKSGWIITLFYALILVIGIHTFAIHRIPQLMAVYMLILFAVAVVVGLIWEKRTFCTYVCPIGHLLGLYSLLSFKQLRVKDKSVCDSCKTKDCIHITNHYKFTGRSCTSELFPPNITDNRACIMCGQCFKSCTKDNIAISKRRFAADLFTNIKLKWAEIAFFITVSGFVVYEILSEWALGKKMLMTIPNWLNHSLDISGNASGTIKAIVLFGVLPWAFYSIFVLAKSFLSKETWKDSFTQLVLAILPITASMHLLKALLKTTSRIPYWNYVFQDPNGVETAKKIMQDKSLLHNDILENYISPGVSFMAITLIISGLVFSIYTINKQKHNNSYSKAISILAAAIYATLFLLSLINWRLL